MLTRIRTQSTFESSPSKNEVEQAGMRAANVRDCAAIMKFFAFLESELRRHDHNLDEFKAARKMDHFRTYGEHFV